MKIIKEEVRDPETFQIIDYKVGECEWCDDPVELSGFTNPCEGCGTCYNWSGQRLAPVEQWGEETGEHYLDILPIK